MRGTKAYTLPAQFSGKATISMDCIDPRIGSQLAPYLEGGLNSNASILAALVTGKTGYTGDVRTEDVLAKYLPPKELCEFLGIDSLGQFDPNLHGRLAFKFFVGNVVADLNGVLQHGQLSVEITQFGPLTEANLPGLFKPEEREVMGEAFFAQFHRPTLAEMLAEAVVMDGGLSRTAVKVALGWEGYHVISQLWGLGICANATLAFPTQKPYTDPEGENHPLGGDMALAAKLGAGMLSPFIRRSIGKHGEEAAWELLNESLELSRRQGAVTIAASIGDQEMAERALRLGSHIVATPPNKIGDGSIDACQRWLAERVPQVVAEAQRIELPTERRILSFSKFDGRGEPVHSPLSADGHGSFVHDEILATHTLARFIERQMKTA
jgi:transaldolase